MGSTNEEEYRNENCDQMGKSFVRYVQMFSEKRATTPNNNAL